MANHDQADVIKAVNAGNTNNTLQSSASTSTPKTDDPITTTTNSNKSNNNHNSHDPGNNKEDARMTAQDILLSLPGINVHNFRDVMNDVKNLSDLFDKSEDSMCQLLGSVNGKKLFAFVNQCH